jgi:hypothetical protein
MGDLARDGPLTVHDPHAGAVAHGPGVGLAVVVEGADGIDVGLVIEPDHLDAGSLPIPDAGVKVVHEEISPAQPIVTLNSRNVRRGTHITLQLAALKRPGTREGLQQGVTRSSSG